jgi:DNA-binding transcriptional regulator LsrR (DeoR family)
MNAIAEMDLFKNLSNPRKLNQFELMIMIAKMYYFENMSQQQIAHKVNMSRSNISRILKVCRDMGIVEIRINEVSVRLFEVKKKLKNRFGVKNIIITPRADDKDANLENIGIAAAGYLEDILEEGMSVGLGWGSSIYKMVKAYPSKIVNGLDIVQLMGGTRIKEAHKDGVQLVLDFAKKTGGEPHILNAPLLVNNKQLKELLIEEGGIKEHLGMIKKIDVAIVALGTNTPENSAMVSFITKEQSKELCDKGLFSHILGQHIDINGQIGDIDLNERVVGIDLKNFKTIGEKIGIAGGEEKVKAIVSGLMGGFIDTLITDEKTAFQVENYAAKHGLFNPAVNI